MSIALLGIGVLTMLTPPCRVTSTGLDAFGAQIEAYSLDRTDDTTSCSA